MVHWIFILPFDHVHRFINPLCGPAYCKWQCLPMSIWFNIWASSEALKKDSRNFAPWYLMLPYQWQSVLRQKLAGNKKKHFSFKKFSSILLSTIGNYRGIQLLSLEICTDKLNFLSGTEDKCLVCPILTTKLS